MIGSVTNTPAIVIPIAVTASRTEPTRPRTGETDQAATASAPATTASTVKATLISHPCRPIAYSLITRHDGSRSARRACSAPSRSTKPAAPATAARPATTRASLPRSLVVVDVVVCVVVVMRHHPSVPGLLASPAQ